MSGAFDGLTPIPARERVLAVARVLHGLPYVWGGNVVADGGADCSGFAQLCYCEAGIAPWAADYPGRLDLTAQGLLDRLAPVREGEHPLPGDLAFYGTAGHAGHVMLVSAVSPGGETVEVMGASRGDRTCTDPVVALRKGARVRTWPSHLYRRDFLGFRRMPAGAPGAVTAPGAAA